MQGHDDAQAPKPQASRTLLAGLAKSAIALRPATPADTEFCYQLHKAAMGAYITAIWGWDELVLDVLAVNCRAQALYRRLGLREVARHGDHDVKVTMRSTRHRT